MELIIIALIAVEVVIVRRPSPFSLHPSQSEHILTVPPVPHPRRPRALAHGLRRGRAVQIRIRIVERRLGAHLCCCVTQLAHLSYPQPLLHIFMSLLDLTGIHITTPARICAHSPLAPTHYTSHTTHCMPHIAIRTPTPSHTRRPFCIIHTSYTHVPGSRMAT